MMTDPAPAANGTGQPQESGGKELSTRPEEHQSVCASAEVTSVAAAASKSPSENAQPPTAVRLATDSMSANTTSGHMVASEDGAAPQTEEEGADEDAEARDVEDVEMDAAMASNGHAVNPEPHHQETIETVHLAAPECSGSAEPALVDPLQPPVVKKRRTKNFKLREHMEKTRSSLQVTIEPFTPETFDSWDDFCEAWAEYMVKTKTLYRRRSSCSTVTWNSKRRFKKYPVPEQFQYATMAYWCTHGCLQPSRGTGVRAHLHNRYTGCSARITAEVVYAKRENVAGGNASWFIRVRNQILNHNHRISDEIFNCYSSNSSVPDDMLLGALEDASSSTSSSICSGSTSSIQPFGAEVPAFVHDAQSSVLSAFEASAHENMAIGGSLDKPVTESRSLSFDKSVLLTQDQKRSMIELELKPLFTELERTSSELFGRRLGELSKLVKDCAQKWQSETGGSLHGVGASSPNTLLADCSAASPSGVVLDFTKNVTEHGSEPKEQQQSSGQPMHIDVVHVL